MAVVTIADRIDTLRRGGFSDATVAAMLGLASSDVALFRADPDNVPVDPGSVPFTDQQTIIPTITTPGEGDPYWLAEVDGVGPPYIFIEVEDTDVVDQLRIRSTTFDVGRVYTITVRNFGGNSLTWISLEADRDVVLGASGGSRTRHYVASSSTELEPLSSNLVQTVTLTDATPAELALADGTTIYIEALTDNATISFSDSPGANGSPVRLVVYGGADGVLHTPAGDVVYNGGGAAVIKDFAWVDADLIPLLTVPIGGATGRVLTKASDSVGDYEWMDRPSLQLASLSNMSTTSIDAGGIRNGEGQLTLSLMLAPGETYVLLFDSNQLAVYSLVERTLDGAVGAESVIDASGISSEQEITPADPTKSTIVRAIFTIAD